MAKAKVHWLSAAMQKIQPQLKPLFTRELATLFVSAEITVHDCLVGYKDEQKQKIILAIEVKHHDSYHMHIVKLGTAKEVGADAAGWRRCAGKRMVASPIFVNVSGKALPEMRAAAVYVDAHILFGPDPNMDRPEILENVAHWAVFDNQPELASVERVISQIFADLQRWFYQGALPDSDGARQFYHERLKKGLPAWTAPVGDSAREPNWRTTLREDAIWLFCGHDAPITDKPAAYLDPFDYVSWALANKKVPPTLVGRSHGDLHGRNILVGVRRGEAEFPVVIDYGEMDDVNVLAWDFAKLEVEMKTRLITRLFDDLEARSALLSGKYGPEDRLGKFLDQRWMLEDDKAGDGAVTSVVKEYLQALFARDTREAVVARAQRAERLSFAFEFEKLLAERTKRILGPTDAESRLSPGGNPLFPRNAKIDKLLRLLLRIRQEAALALGFSPTGRHQHWRDEYYFALAVYGLTTAKWPNYQIYWSEVALVSAGVAVAQMETARGNIQAELTRASAARRPQPTYRIPLHRAHKHWIAGDTNAALKALQGASKDFAHAIPLRQERGLLLAEQGKLEAARDLLQPLVQMCIAFGDYETLSRIARVLKNYGDREWRSHPCAFTELGGRPAAQFYKDAFLLYASAFWISKHYFPGVNAVTLAYLAGKFADAATLAEQVLLICEDERLIAAGKDLYWVFASEGETALVLAALVPEEKNRLERACGFYEAALRQVSAKEIGMVMSTWDQLCRLWQAVGAKIVNPVVDVFKKNKSIWNALEAGPLDNCGRRPH